MKENLDVLILRDPRESIKKCSLTPLRGMTSIRFVEYQHDRVVDVDGRLRLDPRAPELSRADRELFRVAQSGSGSEPALAEANGLLLIDCAWRRVDQLLGTTTGAGVARSLPVLVTAYPRSSRLFQDPSQGLASVEALFAALLILGDERPELLEGYRWRDGFLEANKSELDRFRA